MKSDQINFSGRDAPDMFATPNDKDGKLNEREMSLPSAFFSRESLEDSAHAMIDLSDTGSEDVQVNHRSKLSMAGTVPLGSDRSGGSESETDRDSSTFLGNCVTEDLDLVENAILRLLREDGRLYSKQHDEDFTKLKDALGLDERLEGSEKTQSSAGSLDLQLLSRLLDQVQTLREQKYQHRQGGRGARSVSRGRSVWDITKQGTKAKRINKDDMKRAVQAATQAAKSAAEAAKNASSLVTKNSEAVGKLLQSLNPSTSKPSPKKKDKKTSSENPDDSESSSDSEASSDDSEDVKDIAKKIVKQNRYTHVVLGIMLVSSFVWRYIVVKVARRVKNKVSDPWGYVGGMLTDNFKGPGEKDPKATDSADQSKNDNAGGLTLPDFNLAPILHPDRESKEESDKEVASSPSDGVKERVTNRFGFLQSKGSNGNGQ